MSSAAGDSKTGRRCTLSGVSDVLADGPVGGSSLGPLEPVDSPTVSIQDMLKNLSSSPANIAEDSSEEDKSVPEVNDVALSAAKQFAEVERAYTDKLQVLIAQFLVPMRSFDVLTESQLCSVFSNVEALYSLHVEMLLVIETRFLLGSVKRRNVVAEYNRGDSREGSSPEPLNPTHSLVNVVGSSEVHGDHDLHDFLGVILDFLGQMEREYKEYTSSFLSQMRAYSALAGADVSFLDVVRRTQLAIGEDLDSLMKLPVSRLNNFLRSIDGLFSSIPSLVQFLEKMKDVLGPLVEIGEKSIKEFENEVAIIGLSKQLVGFAGLSGRVYLFEGPALDYLLEPLYLFLLEDVLVVASAPLASSTGRTFQFRHSVNLEVSGLVNEMYVEDDSFCLATVTASGGRVPHLFLVQNRDEWIEAFGRSRVELEGVALPFHPRSNRVAPIEPIEPSVRDVGWITERAQDVVLSVRRPCGVVFEIVNRCLVSLDEAFIWTSGCELGGRVVRKVPSRIPAFSQCTAAVEQGSATVSGTTGFFTFRCASMTYVVYWLVPYPRTTGDGNVCCVFEWPSVVTPAVAEDVWSAGARKAEDSPYAVSRRLKLPAIPCMCSWSITPNAPLPLLRVRLDAVTDVEVSCVSCGVDLLSMDEERFDSTMYEAICKQMDSLPGVRDGHRSRLLPVVDRYSHPPGHISLWLDAGKADNRRKNRGHDLADSRRRAKKFATFSIRLHSSERMSVGPMASIASEFSDDHSLDLRSTSGESTRGSRRVVEDEWSGAVSEPMNKSRIILRMLKEELDGTNVEAPLCAPCARAFLDSTGTEADLLEEQNVTLSSVLSEEEDMIESEFAELERVEAEERALEEEFRDLERDLTEVRRRGSVLEVEDSRMDRIEDRIFREANEVFDALRMVDEQNESIGSEIVSLLAALDSLSTVNPLSDAFPIWSDGLFGTIGSLRLGRLSVMPVEWSEINAAMWNVGLLISAMARTVGFSFREVILDCSGAGNSSAPRLASVSNSGDWYSLAGPCESKSTQSRLDRACSLLATGVRELADFLATCKQTKVKGRVKVPYEIEVSDVASVGGVSLSSASEPDWTRALKLLLIDLKYLTAVSTPLIPIGPEDGIADGENVDGDDAS